MLKENAVQGSALESSLCDNDLRLYNGVGDLESSTSLPRMAIVRVVYGALGVSVSVTVDSGTYRFILPHDDYDKFMGLLKRMQSGEYGGYPDLVKTMQEDG